MISARRIALIAGMLVGSSPVMAQDIGLVPRNWRTAQVSVATTATLVADTLPTRRRVLITTTGTNQVTCGPTNAVTAGNGQPIAPVAYSTISIETSATVWCIAATTQVVAVTENY